MDLSFGGQVSEADYWNWDTFEIPLYEFHCLVAASLAIKVMQKKLAETNQLFLNLVVLEMVFSRVWDKCLECEKHLFSLQHWDIDNNRPFIFT